MEEIKIKTEDCIELNQIKPTQEINIILEQDFISYTWIDNLRIFLDNMEEIKTKVTLTIKSISIEDLLELTWILLYDVKTKRSYKV